MPFHCAIKAPLIIYFFLLVFIQCSSLPNGVRTPVERTVSVLKVERGNGEVKHHNKLAILVREHAAFFS